MLRVAVQAQRIGWLMPNVLVLLSDRWQFVQSVVVAIVAAATIVQLRRLANRLQRVEAVIGDAVDRMSSVSLQDLKLTPREQEVLKVIGTNTHIDDKSLAAALSISPDTAHTHVSNLLRKTKLRDRRDLIIVAFLIEAASPT